MMPNVLVGNSSHFEHNFEIWSFKDRLGIAELLNWSDLSEVNETSARNLLAKVKERFPYLPNPCWRFSKWVLFFSSFSLFLI
jgi:hypothetical protein